MTTRRDNREGSFTATDAGTWECRLRVGEVRIKARGKTKAEALRRAREKADLVTPQRRSMETFGDLFAEWCSKSLDDRGIRATTADNYATLIRRWVLPSLGDVRLGSLSATKLGDVVEAIEGSAAARRNTYAAMMKVLNYGVQRRRLARNPLRDVDRPKPRPRVKREVQASDAIAILKAARGHRYEVAAWLLFGCGLRRGEVLGLRWRDVDLDAGTLVVAGDGNVTRTSAGLRRGAPKTRNGLRRIPLSVEVGEMLRAHRQRQIAARLTMGPAWQDSDAVVANEIGGLVDPRNLSREFGKWCKAAGVEGAPTHDGRRFAATTLLASGAVSVVDAAASMGMTPSVVTDIYAGSTSPGRETAARILGSRLSAAL